MPNVWTHIHFAETVAEAVGYSVPSNGGNFFRLGAQGPDPFFYHRFWPWMKDKPAGEIGGKIHDEQCGAFLSAMIQCGSETADPWLRAYILGFVTHHILDRNAHSYINYRSGDEGNKHQELEVIIDTLLMEEIRGIQTWNTPVYQEIEIGKTLYEPVEQLLDTLTRKLFPDTAAKMPADYINKSYQDMITALRVLYDPKGWKNKLLKKQISSFSYQPVAGNSDYLNRERSQWLHPIDDSEVHSESFDDLFEDAFGEGREILTAILNDWNRTDKKSAAFFEQLLGNISYSTGKDCTLALKNQHFDPIL